MGNFTSKLWVLPKSWQEADKDTVTYDCALGTWGLPAQSCHCPEACLAAQPLGLLWSEPKEPALLPGTASGAHVAKAGTQLDLRAPRWQNREL